MNVCQPVVTSSLQVQLHNHYTTATYGVECRQLPFSWEELEIETSGYATWFAAGGAIRIAQYDVIDDVITRKL